MSERKITLEELAMLNDGTCVDLEVLNEQNDSLHAFVKDEIDDFLAQPKMKNKPASNSFYSTIPSCNLKSNIDRILKSKNIKEEIQKKHAKYEFDVKMARIRKIKSKTYRKMKRRDKLRKNEMLEPISEEENSEQEDKESENLEEFRPVLSFNNKIEIAEESEEASNTQNAIVSAAFCKEDTNLNEKEFLREKTAVTTEDAPKILEHSLPGWDTWAGEGIEFVKNKFNTIIEKKPGIRVADRQDYRKSNVIINENMEIPAKYVSNLPYGFSSKEYKRSIYTPVSLETNSLRVFNKFVKMVHKEENPAGKDIMPQEFDPEYC